ncbi:MAG: terpene cyclase/mutase family protein [Verrucomicrobiae bacterium]|nr:terpene cyclase/mutase family protein [Verrucomicrobiae bacterium]
MSYSYRPFNPWEEPEPEKLPWRWRLWLLLKRWFWAGVDRIPGGEKGKRAVLWALIFHLVVLIVAVVIVVVPREDDAPEIIAEVIVPDRVLDVEMQRLSAVKQLAEVRASASSSMMKMMRANTASVIAAPEVELENPGPLGLGLGDLGAGMGMGSGGGGGGGMNMARIPAVIRGRCVPGERIRLLRSNGGTAEVEDTVVKALDWLQGAQNPDGSWGTTYQAAMTGFALLSYLGHCETPRSAQYGDTVLKGLQALVEMSRRGGGRMRNVGNKNWAYEHGIATYALGEALMLTREEGTQIPELESVYANAVRIVIEGQNSDGGWVYGYTRQGAGDLSVTGWQFQALKTAQYARLDEPELDGAIGRTSRFVSERQGDQGGFGYRNRGDKPSLTGVGLVGLQLLGGGQGSRIKRGLEYFFKSGRGNFKYDQFNCDLYAWYYITQAAFYHGGDEWQHWNEIFRGELMKNQRDNGVFDREGSGKSDGSGDPDIYRTCLCVLMLEVYYRYLPATG